MALQSVANTAPVNRGRAAVKFKRATKHNTRFPFFRLPFISSKGGLWDMLSSAGYGTGCDMGKAAGEAYMKALRASSMGGGHLQHLILDLVASGIDFQDIGRRGQIVGLFSYLDAWLSAASRDLGGSLDKITEKEIERRMTRAASETEEEYSDRHTCWVSNDD